MSKYKIIKDRLTNFPIWKQQNIILLGIEFSLAC